MYDEVFAMTAPGGVFFNLDYIFARSPSLAAIYTRALGPSPWDTALSAPTREPEAATLEDQLRWIREAGFSEVDCLRKEFSEVLLCGIRASQ